MKALRPAAGWALMLVLPVGPLASSRPQETPVAKDAGSPLSGPGVVHFDFERPGLPVPHWAIEIAADGSGRYDDLSVGPGTGPGNGLGPGNGQVAATESRQAIRVSAQTRQRLDSGFDKVSAGGCETRSRHLANMGTKKISYQARASDLWVSCTFNYSDDKNLMETSDTFLSIAETVQTGLRLQHTHRFDRLGLDAAMDSLTDAVAAGRALEIQNIAPTLQSIVSDERVMDRVRRKAARLLQDGGVAAPAGPVSPELSPR